MQTHAAAIFIDYIKLATVFLPIGLLSCGNMPVDSTMNKTGSLQIAVSISQSSLYKTMKANKTSYDSLIVEIQASDMQTMHKAIKITAPTEIVKDSIINIPAGEQRNVNVWTVDKSGVLIHKSSGASIIQIGADSVSKLDIILQPAVGSIYLQIGDVPTTVKSVSAIFNDAASQKQWLSSVARSSRVFLSLDNIPNNTRGIVHVFGVDSLGDTLYRAQADLIIDVTKSAVINLKFQDNSGNMALNVTIINPGISLVSGRMGSADTETPESGELLITEIMYAADDSEYIELYNPSGESITYESLIIDIDGKSKTLSNVSFTPYGFVVIGRDSLSWIDYPVSPKSFFDLSSNGNWVTASKKDGTILDRVVFTGGSNNIEWPNVSGKRAISLNRNALNALDNNFGRNWQAETTLIKESVSQYGTPKM